MSYWSPKNDSSSFQFYGVKRRWQKSEMKSPPEFEVAKASL
jgi:hypothetical protein